MDILKRLLAIAFFTITLLWLSRALFLHNYPDFNVFYGGLKAYLHGGNPYEMAEGSVMKFLYPPFALLFFLPLISFSREVASVIWVGFSIGLLLASNIFIFMGLKKKVLSPEFFVLNGFVFSMFCVKFNLGMGQFNNVNLFLVSLAFYFFQTKREVSAGISIGLSLLLKVVPLLLLPYLFMTKRIKGFWTVILVGIVGILLSALFIRSDLTVYFLRSLSGTLASWPLDYYNQALSGFLGRQFGTGELSSMLKLILTLFLILGSYFILWTRRNNKKVFPLGFVSLLPLTLVTLTFSWQHYFVLTIPSFIVLYFHYKNVHARWKSYILLVVSYIFVASNLESPHVYPLIIQSHMLVGTLLLLVLCLYSYYHYD